MAANEPEGVCKSVFKGGDGTRAERFTKKWIELINASERKKELTSNELCAEAPWET